MEIRKYGRVSSQAVQQQPAVLDTIVKVNTSAAKNKYMFYEIVNDNDFKEIITNDLREQEMVNHTKSGLQEGNRELYIPDAAMLILEKILSMAKTEELFLGKTGKWLLTQELNQHLKDACEALGIEYLSTHKVRSWFATEAAKNGMDDVTMMTTFGWKDRDTAKTYIRKARTKSAQKEVIEQIIDFSV